MFGYLYRSQSLVETLAARAYPHMNAFWPNFRVDTIVKDLAAKFVLHCHSSGMCKCIDP